MITEIPPLRPRRGARKARRRPPAPPVVVPLVLVSAVYDSAVPRVILGFNQPVDLNALDAPTITVDDAAELNLRYYAFNGPNMIDPATFWLELVADGPATGSGTTLTASALNGIAPAGGGDAWAGVEDLELPFP